MKETSLAFYCTARRLLSIPCCDLYYYYYYRIKYNLSNFNLLRQYEIAIVLVCDCAFASNNLLRTLWIRTNKQNGQIKTSAHHTAHTCVVHPVMDNSADTWDEGESSGLVVNLVSQMGQAKWARSYTYVFTDVKSICISRTQLRRSLALTQNSRWFMVYRNQKLEEQTTLNKRKKVTNLVNHLV